MDTLSLKVAMPWGKGTGWSVSSAHGCGHSQELRVAMRRYELPGASHFPWAQDKVVPVPWGDSSLEKFQVKGCKHKAHWSPGKDAQERVPRGFGWNTPVSATEEGAHLLQVGQKTKKGIYHTPLIGEKCRINAKRHRPGRWRLVFDSWLSYSWCKYLGQSN